MMRRLIAMLLLACLGMMIPTAVMPMRICSLESSVHLAGFQSFGIAHEKDGSEKVKCCPHCGEDEDENNPCCVELKKLPDSPEAPMLFGLPAFLPVELADFQISVERIEFLLPEVFEAARPIRGPTDHSRRRAMLGVWTI